MAKILGFGIGISSISWAFSENDELKDAELGFLQRLKIPKQENL